MNSKNCVYQIIDDDGDHAWLIASSFGEAVEIWRGNLVDEHGYGPAEAQGTQPVSVIRVCSENELIEGPEARQ